MTSSGDDMNTETPAVPEEIATGLDRLDRMVVSLTDTNRRQRLKIAELEGVVEKSEILHEESLGRIRSERDAAAEELSANNVRARSVADQLTTMAAELAQSADTVEPLSAEGAADIDSSVEAIGSKRTTTYAQAGVFIVDGDSVATASFPALDMGDARAQLLDSLEEAAAGGNHLLDVVFSGRDGIRPTAENLFLRIRVLDDNTRLDRALAALLTYHADRYPIFLVAPNGNHPLIVPPESFGKAVRSFAESADSIDTHHTKDPAGSSKGES